MNAERELLKRLVDASNEAYSFEQLGELCDPIAEDAKDLLAQPEREPLTNEQIEAISNAIERSDFFECVVPFARAIERAHGIE